MIPRYNVYNGLAITSLLNRLHEMVSVTDLQDFGEDLNLEDDDAQGTCTWASILKNWKTNQLPRLDEELQDFMHYLAMRNSEGSDRIYIAKFLEVFDEDYLLTDCKLGDTTRFNATGSVPDQEDLDNHQKELERLQQIEDAQNAGEASINNQDEMLFFVD